MDNQRHNILLIDDDDRLAGLLGQYFERYDLSLDNALRPSDGLEKLENGNYSLVILDVMLPEMDGFEVCKLIRKQNDIPIIMLTARGDVMDRVIGLELGADDYLPKPFEARELVARIQSILKRSSQHFSQQSTPKEQMYFEHLVIDTGMQQVSLDDKEVHLSTMEYQLLEFLARHIGKTQSRDDILNALKGVETELFSRSVDIAISRLRQKLKPHELIKTIRGSGYVFIGKAL